MMQELKKLWQRRLEPRVESFSPYTRFEKSGNRKKGEELIREGHVGCLILAGGQGTRFGFDGPKGTFPVSVTGKSLFQLFCERAQATCEWSGQSLPLCIMTSPLNHVETVNFFERHAYFGLLPSQLFFLQQKMLPLLNEQGEFFFEKPDQLAMGPDGNGRALELFFESGIWAEWSKKGIKYLHVIPIENALAHPFDSELIGFTAEKQVDVALKAVTRLSSEEKMGILAESQGKLKVIEYSELPKDSTPFTLSHTGLFCFSMQWIYTLYAHGSPAIPLHFAEKIGLSSQPIFKCERFLFDLLDYASSSAVLLASRDKTYAPLKNATGEKSLKTVQEALLAFDREIYRARIGSYPSTTPFELDPSFYW